MKKLLFIIIPALTIALLTYLAILHFQNQNSQKGALQVTSSPTSKVYLDDKYIGRTPISKIEAADMIQAGNYTIRLVPEDSSLTEYQEKITITTGIMTVVDRKFSKGSLSEGSVISLIPLQDKDKIELEVISFPENSVITLDSDQIGKTPLLYSKITDSDHILNISKDGYSEKAVRIHTPKGYRLTVVAYLAVNSADTLNAKPTPSIVSTTLQPSPIASPSASKVTILDTPTGFLRVRESNNLSAAQVTTVAPGDTYPLVSEEPGWFEIKLQNGQTGWISSQYAKKQ